MRPADVEISEALPDDAPEISEFAIQTYVDAFGGGFRPDDLAYHLASSLSVARWQEYLARDKVLIARDGRRLVGYVQFGPGDAAGEVEVHRLYVERESQGRGIGTRLLTEALRHTDVAGAVVVIGVWEENPGAQRLYARFGFVAKGERRPFVLRSGEIDGYDMVMVRRPGAESAKVQG